MKCSHLETYNFLQVKISKLENGICKCSILRITHYVDEQD